MPWFVRCGARTNAQLSVWREARLVVHSVLDIGLFEMVTELAVGYAQEEGYNE